MRTAAAIQVGPDSPPSLMNCAACDDVTGYLAAVGVVAALQRREREGGSWEVRVSLAQTGRWLRDLAAPRDISVPVDLRVPAAFFIESETPIGRLQHLNSAVRISATPTRWTLPATPIGQHPPLWTTELDDACDRCADRSRPRVKPGFMFDSHRWWRIFGSLSTNQKGDFV